MEEKRNTEVADKDLPEAEYGSFRGRARAQSVDSAFSMLQGCTERAGTFLILLQHVDSYPYHYRGHHYDLTLASLLALALALFVVLALCSSAQGPGEAWNSCGYSGSGDGNGESKGFPVPLPAAR